MLSNFPNPFKNSTCITFNISHEQSRIKKPVIIEIFNIKGQFVKKYIIANNQSSVVWDGKDRFGNSLNSGIYFYKMKYGKFIYAKKLILMK
jgi:flagellar hook assembly protein FlgD